MAEKKLTERQKRFIDAYIKTGNASEAARRAGYSPPKDANVIGARLLANVSISQELEKRLKELKNERTADLQETLEYVTAVMRGQVVDVVLIDGVRIELPPRTRDRLKAAEHLLKVYGAFKNEVQVTGIIPVVISGGNELED